MSKITIEDAKPLIGGIVHVDRAHLTDAEVIEELKTALELRGVLVFPRLHATDEEQLAFTDAFGGRVNFNKGVPGSNASAEDVYKITLDRALNSEPDYVLGTFFWHVDGVTIDQSLPKATILSARTLSDAGGATEFANLYAAYEHLPEDEKRQYEGLEVIHTVEAAVRPVYGSPPQERLDRYRSMAAGMEQPLVWTHESGRKSLLIGTHADGIVGMPGPHARALITRLIQWAAQPQFVYRHQWQVGDMAVWDNQGLMHRVVPYTDEGRVMHRTSIGGHEKPGHVASDENKSRMFELS